jgi:hypothetical protein
MKKTRMRKLSLNRETLRQLGNAAQHRAGGLQAAGNPSRALPLHGPSMSFTQS